MRIERPGSDGEEEFDPQFSFDKWIVSSSLLGRKMLLLLLTENFQKRFN